MESTASDLDQAAQTPETVENPEAAETPGTAGATGTAGGHDETPERHRTPIDLGQTIATTAALLQDMERSGEDFNGLSAPGFDEGRWEQVWKAAEKREQDNDHVFAGELEAFRALHAISDPLLLSKIHTASRLYWRRASTSAKVGLALDDSYDAAMSPGADPTILNPGRFRKQLKELLGVIVSLSEQHDELIALIRETENENKQLAQKTYDDRTTGLLAEYDALDLQRQACPKFRFNKRKELLGKMRERLEKLAEINESYAGIDYIELQTRVLPED